MEGRILREIYDDNLKEKIRLKLLENGKIVFTVVPVGKMEDNIMCMEKPMLAHIRLTSRCNLNCSYCYAHDNSETEDMSDEQVVQLIDLCNKKGVMNITWTGGEPLLRDIFIQAVNRANRYGINQTVLTNGLKINELELEKIPKENINFQISLNNVWENPGYIQLVLENSKKLVENSYNVIISVMLKVVDISEVRQLLETLVKYSIPSVRFGVEVFVGGLKNEDVSLYESDIKKMFGNFCTDFSTDAVPKRFWNLPLIKSISVQHPVSFRFFIPGIRKSTTMYICTVSFPVQDLLLIIRSGKERKTSFSEWKSCGISLRVNFSQDCSHSFKTDSCIFQLPVKNCAILMNGLNSGIPFIKRIGALMSKKLSMALAMPLNIWAGILIRSPYRIAVSCQ